MKPKISFALLIVQLLVLLICVPGTTWASDDAVAFRTNVGHSAENAMPDFVAPLGVKWDIQLPGIVQYPLVANGVVYVNINGRYSTPSVNTEAIYALNAGNGDIIWGPVTPTIGSPVSMVYDNGQIYTAVGSLQGVIVEAYDATTGNKLWLNVYPSPQADLTPILTASGGQIYIQAEGVVDNINESDGSIKWTQSVMPNETGIAVSPHGIFLTDGGGPALALDPSTGNQIWSLVSGSFGGGGSTAVNSEGFVFDQDFYDPALYPYATAVIDAVSGSLLAELPAEGYPAIENGRMFTATSSAVIARSSGDWSILWTKTDAAHPPLTFPTAVNGVVYVATGGHTLKGYDEFTGNEVASIPLTETPDFSSQDIIAGDGLLLIPFDNRLVAVGSALPTVNATLSPSTPNGTNGWYTVPVTVTINSDGNLVEYSVDGANPKTYFHSFDISGDAKHIVKYWTTDGNGNQGTPLYIYINIDATSPVTSESGYSGNTNATAPVTLTLSASDNLSGVLITQYSINNSAFATYQQPLVIQSKSSVSYRSIDFAGNVEASHTLNINIPVDLGTFNPGLQMIAFTQDYSNTPLNQIFGPEIPTFAIWDPLNLKYDITPTSPANSISIGRGYWVRFAQGTDLISLGTPADTTKSFSIPIQVGWNMFGSPWTTLYNIGSVQTTDPSGNIISIVDPASPITPTFYSYPANSTAYTKIQWGVSTNNPADDAFRPGLGYWLYSSKACTITFDPPGVANIPPGGF